MTWVLKKSILFWCFLEIWLTLKPRHRWSFSAAYQGLSCPCWCSLLVQREKKSNCNFNVNANNFNFNVSVNLHHLKWRIPARFCCQHASGRGNPEEVQVHQVDFSPFIMDYSYKLLFLHMRDYFFSPEQFCHETHDTPIEPVAFLGLPPLRCGSDPFWTWPTIFITNKQIVKANLTCG